MLATPETLTFSWIGRDPESDISSYHVSVGMYPGDHSVTGGYLDVGLETVTTLTGLNLKVGSNDDLAMLHILDW